ncbi:MAG: hypothetical protein R2734_12275 [Nocardioides sp.]
MLAAAEVGFVAARLHRAPVTVVSNLLREADPHRYAARYPPTGVVESYGEQWPAPAWTSGPTSSQPPGWATWRTTGEPLGRPGAAGDGRADVQSVARWLAELLGVPLP